MAEPVWARCLFPGPSENVDARALYRADDLVLPQDRPYVVVNMVASVDGATAMDGVTRPLGSPTDRAIFLHLREVVDAILVGAATVRAERYGPARPSPEAQALRQSRGQSSTPPIVAVSRSLEFDWNSPFFAEAISRPILVVPADIGEELLGPARLVADVIQAGEGSVQVSEALGQLRDRGVRVLLCEGGPTLNAELLRAGLVDELCLTIAPLVVGGAGPKGIFGLPAPMSAASLGLVHVLEADGCLFLRYRVER